MKRVFKKKDEAVSPIVATILLVAITVVLAATLYTILGGYTTFLGASTPTGSVHITNESSPGLPYYTVYVYQFGGNVSLNFVTLRIVTSNGTMYNTPVTAGVGAYPAGNGLWNITVTGPNYFGVLTALTIKGTSSNPVFIKEIQFIDLKTNGLIGSSTPES